MSVELLPAPLTTFYGSIVVYFGVFCGGVLLISILFFFWEILPMGYYCMMQKCNRQFTNISY